MGRWFTEAFILKKQNWIKWSVLAAAGLLVAAEVGLRWVGLVDFPVYDTDDQIGYIPAPSQSGNFFNHNRWIVNSLSMGSGPWVPHGAHDVLLLGDSLVWGGNPLNQIDKLGPQLEARLSGRWLVWPASAGSWAVLNEVTYLDRHTDVVADAEKIVWVLNTGDFIERTQWSSELTHPRSKPLSALVYAVQKYALPHLHLSEDVEAKVVQPVILPESAAALKNKLATMDGRKVLIVLYPDRMELATPTPHYLAFRTALKQAMAGCCQFLELREEAEWKQPLYRDDIHPSAAGNRVLAEVLAKHLVH